MLKMGQMVEKWHVWTYIHEKKKKKKCLVCKFLSIIHILYYNNNEYYTRIFYGSFPSVEFLQTFFRSYTKIVCENVEEISLKPRILQVYQN